MRKPRHGDSRLRDDGRGSEDWIVNGSMASEFDDD